MVKGKIATAPQMPVHLLWHGIPGIARQGTRVELMRCGAEFFHDEDCMGRAAILWFLGVPIPVLLLMWGLGWLH